MLNESAIIDHELDFDTMRKEMIALGETQMEYDVEVSFFVGDDIDLAYEQTSSMGMVLYADEKKSPVYDIYNQIADQTDNQDFMVYINKIIEQGNS